VAIRPKRIASIGRGHVKMILRQETKITQPCVVIAGKPMEIRGNATVPKNGWEASGDKGKLQHTEDSELRRSGEEMS